VGWFSNLFGDSNKLTAEENEQLKCFDNELVGYRREMTIKLAASIAAGIAQDAEGMVGKSWSLKYKGSSRQMISVTISPRVFETYLDGYIYVYVSCGSPALYHAVSKVVAANAGRNGETRTFNNGLQCAMPGAPLARVTQYWDKFSYIFDRDTRRSLWDD